MDWKELAKTLVLADRRITEPEAELIRDGVMKDGVVDRQELEFLVDLKKTASSIHPTFDDFFFKIVKKKVLVDGDISDAEAVWLRTVIYSDRQATETEQEFLQQLKKEARTTGKEFQKLHRDCTQLAKTDFYD